MPFKPMPPLDAIKAHLRYDPDTGYFQRISRQLGGKPNHKPFSGSFTASGYVMVTVPGYGQLFAHRLAWAYVHGSMPTEHEIDHMDGNPANNAISNLRIASSSQQKMNKTVQSNNRSGLKGAYYHACRKGKKWRSQIKVGQRLIFLGYFQTAEEAHDAYTVAAVEHHGEFARADTVSRLCKR